MKAEEPILEYGQLDLNGSYTYSDYLRWHFKERVELIKGKILKMSPAPSTKHQIISLNTTRAFDRFFLHSPCQFFVAPFDVRLPLASVQKDSTVVQPDLCVICDRNKIDDKGCNGAPDLVVEILSPGNTRHEIKTKFDLYEESGVKEYWLVEPNDKVIFIYALMDGKYIGLRPFSEGDQLESPLFPEIKITADEIFRDLI